MSIPEPWPSDGPKLSEDAATGNGRSSNINQPWRAAVAVAEWLVAAVSVGMAWWAWGHSVVSIKLPAPEGMTDVVTRTMGNWVTLAVVFATLAALVIVDSSRQVLLALGTHRRRKSRDRESAGAATS